ncbi:MAG: 2-hydroxyacyl-CoA dehydratase [Spirochaetes bacterium]|nr:2-hydroxyacyl-CoA dehydratase [Spirochaetota bacterium]
MTHRAIRSKQFGEFLALAKAKKDRSTMKDATEKMGELSNIPYDKLTAAQKRGRLITKLITRAYDPNEYVIWHSLFMPSEIFYGMGMVPFSTEMVSAGLAGAGLSKGLVEMGEMYTQCMDSCSFSTCTIGAITSDVFPIPDFLITTSQLCDPEKKLGRFASENYKRKDFFIDIPYGGCLLEGDAYDTAVDYVAKQLEYMVAFFERETGMKLDNEKLARALDNSNKAREWFLKIDELRANNPALIKGTKILDFSAVLLDIWGSEEAVDIFKTLHDELVESAAKGGMSEQYRIGWIHLRPYYDNTIINYLEEECGAYIVKEEINYIFWEAHDLNDPFRSIARKVLANPAYSPLTVKNKIYSDVIKKFRLDGMFGFAHKGCRHFYSSLHIASDSFKGKCPFIVIDGDCVDPRAYSFPLIKTRVDSFVDTMKIRKEGM